MLVAQLTESQGMVLGVSLISRPLLRDRTNLVPYAVYYKCDCGVRGSGLVRSYYEAASRTYKVELG
jgi:hypothetical protein